MKLRKGYGINVVSDNGHTCGDGGEIVVQLRYYGDVVATYHTCHCGRGCGNRDCVRDDWGYHDCEEAIELARAD